MRTSFAQKIPRRLSSRSGRGFERDAIPVAFQRLNGPMADPLRVSAVVIVGALGLAAQPPHRSITAP